MASLRLNNQASAPKIAMSQSAVIPSVHSPQSILLIGTSPKFIDLMAKLYSNAKQSVVSWRLLGEPQTRQHISQGHFDLVLICGYDYGSYMDSYERYFERNVTAPIAALMPLINRQIAMIYIDTMDAQKPATYSRYAFAKKSLAYQLTQSQAHVAILPIPTITHQNGGLAIYGGWFTRALFTLMQKLGLVQIIAPDALQTKLQLAYLSLNRRDFNPKKVEQLRGVGLTVPRPILLDRALRIVCG